MQQRRPIIAGNWKMYKTVGEAVSFVQEFKNLMAGAAQSSGVEVVLCPPFTALAAVAKQLEGSAINLGAQNMHWQNQGAYTGEISPNMLREIGCKYVILGHSERRQYFGETDAAVNQKVLAALEHGLTPIICVGELLEQREAGETQAVVGKQLEGALVGLKAERATNLVVAYEPVWAIGTGKTASDDDAQQVNNFIRTLLGKLFNEQVAQAVRIQYGGSVKPANTKGLMSQPDVDGALVGGASLAAADFFGIVQNALP